MEKDVGGPCARLSHSMPPRSRLYLGGLLALSNAGRGHRTAGSQARRSQHLRAPRKMLPQGRCLGSRGFGLGSPLVPSSTPHACSGPSTGFGGLTAVRPLRTHRPLGASTRPRSAGRPPPATGLAVTHARRRETLRTSRDPLCKCLHCRIFLAKVEPPLGPRHRVFRRPARRQCRGPLLLELVHSRSWHTGPRLFKNLGFFLLIFL